MFPYALVPLGTATIFVSKTGPFFNSMLRKQRNV
jgi:hypothetical protein